MPPTFYEIVRDLPANKAVADECASPAPETPPEAPTGLPATDLLYKAARAAWLRRALRDPYPALTKAAKTIGAVKHQPSALKVTAIGEGDTSRLKIKPWQLNGQDAWNSLDETRRKK